MTPNAGKRIHCHCKPMATLSDSSRNRMTNATRQPPTMTRSRHSSRRGRQTDRTGQQGSNQQQEQEQEAGWQLAVGSWPDESRRLQIDSRTSRSHNGRMQGESRGRRQNSRSQGRRRGRNRTSKRQGPASRASRIRVLTGAPQTYGRPSAPSHASHAPLKCAPSRPFLPAPPPPISPSPPSRAFSPQMD